MLKTACKNSQNTISDHFVDVNKIVNAGATSKDIGDIELSRYACYLIVQNGDSRKKVIALGQTYFAVKTRQQELIENYDRLSEDQKRLAIRKEMAEHNKLLVAAAKDAGVKSTLDYAIFQNYGYMGLYGGLKAKDIKAKKGLNKNQQILDHMGYEELAANLFRATQTEAKLRRENITGKKCYKTHLDVGRKVRETIADLGVQCLKICQLQQRVFNKFKKSRKIKIKLKTAPAPTETVMFRHYTRQCVMSEQSEDIPFI